MGGIQRLGFVEIGAADLDEAATFYETVIGLQTTEQQGSARYLKCWDEYDHHSVVLHQTEGPGLVQIGWKVESEDALAGLESNVEQWGVTTRRLSAKEEPGLGEAVAFDAPSGQTMILYHDVEQVGRAIAPPVTNPIGLPGIAPPRLDHVGLCAEDGPASIRFLTEALGLHISEQIVDPEGNVRSAFMFAQNKTHDVVIGPGPNGRFHHFAFNVDGWDEVRQAARILGEAGRPLEVPPSQHGIARQNTIYFKDRAGNRLETATSGYLACPDAPPVTWTMQNIGKAMFNFGGPYDPAAFQQFI